jgi:serine/threonine-protein kinase RsbW
MKKVPQQVWLRFNDSCYFSIVRGNTEFIAKKMGFNEERTLELALAVDEAYVNAIEHGSSRECTIALEVEYLIYDDRLEITIRDSGCGFDINSFKIPATLKDVDGVRGRGLSIISQLSDHLVLDSIPGSGTLIKIIKFIEKSRKKKFLFQGKA